MPAPAIDTVYKWGDFFGYLGANEFTEFTRDWVPMVGAEHIYDDAGIAAHLYYGGHDSPMIARAGGYVRTARELAVGEPLWTFVGAGILSVTDTGVEGEVEVILSPAMPSASFMVQPYPLNEPLPPGKTPRPPWVSVRLKQLPTLTDRFSLIIQKDTTVNGESLDSATSAEDLSFGFFVYHS